MNNRSCSLKFDISDFATIVSLAWSDVKSIENQAHLATLINKKKIWENFTNDGKKNQTETKFIFGKILF